MFFIDFLHKLSGSVFSRKSIVITVLFDIDGTLIRTGGAGMVAISQVMNEMFQVKKVAKVPVHGRTDQGILTDLFEAHGLSFAQHREAFSQRYWELLPATLASGSGELLPGAKELLARLEAKPDIELGILTGNARRAAEIKLEHFGLQKFFRFGGYGDYHASRNDVAMLARKAAEDAVADAFDPSHLWVVGDTVNDVACGRWIDAKVIAVETGGSDPEELRASEPDCQLATLRQTEDFLWAIGS